MNNKLISVFAVLFIQLIPVHVFAADVCVSGAGENEWNGTYTLNGGTGHYELDGSHYIADMGGTFWSITDDPENFTFIAYQANSFGAGTPDGLTYNSVAANDPAPSVASGSCTPPPSPSSSPAAPSPSSTPAAPSPSATPSVSPTAMPTPSSSPAAPSPSPSSSPAAPSPSSSPAAPSPSATPSVSPTAMPTPSSSPAAPSPSATPSAMPTPSTSPSPALPSPSASAVPTPSTSPSPGASPSPTPVAPLPLPSSAPVVSIENPESICFELIGTDTNFDGHRETVTLERNGGEYKFHYRGENAKISVQRSILGANQFRHRITLSYKAELLLGNRTFKFKKKTDWTSTSSDSNDFLATYEVPIRFINPTTRTTAFAKLSNGACSTNSVAVQLVVIRGILAVPDRDFSAQDQGSGTISAMLYKGSGPSSDNANDLPVKVVTVQPDGSYEFSDVPPGEYYVAFFAEEDDFDPPYVAVTSAGEEDEVVAGSVEYTPIVRDAAGCTEQDVSEQGLALYDLVLRMNKTLGQQILENTSLGENRLASKQRKRTEFFERISAIYTRFSRTSSAFKDSAGSLPLKVFRQCPDENECSLKEIVRKLGGLRGKSKILLKYSRRLLRASVKSLGRAGRKVNRRYMRRLQTRNRKLRRQVSQFPKRYQDCIIEGDS